MNVVTLLTFLTGGFQAVISSHLHLFLISCVKQHEVLEPKEENAETVFNVVNLSCIFMKQSTGMRLPW